MIVPVKKSLKFEYKGILIMRECFFLLFLILTVLVGDIIITLCCIV
jgi:hypothetical protein